MRCHCRCGTTSPASLIKEKQTQYTQMKICKFRTSGCLSASVVHEICCKFLRPETTLAEITSGRFWGPTCPFACDSSTIRSRGAETVRRWDPLGGGKRRALLRHILVPGRCKLQDLPAGLEKWEELVRRYERSKSSGNDDSSSE